MSLAAVDRLLQERTGIDPATLGSSALGRAVALRMQQLRVPDADAYLCLLQDAHDELTGLVAELLVHETWFFRYPRSFDRLVEDARRHLEDHELWCVVSAACSTGEEPASLVAALLEGGIPLERVVLDAFDVSATAIARARSGWYPRSAVRGEASERMSRWLEPGSGGLQLAAAIRDPIRYQVADVLRGALGGVPRYDAVLCRNLLIYLTPAARTRLLGHVRHALRPGGVLYLGHAEVSAAARHGFRPLPPPEAFVCAPQPAPAGVGAPAPSPTSAPAPLVRPVAQLRVVPPPSVASPPARAPSRAPAPALPAPANPFEEARRLADGGRLAEALAVVERWAEAGGVDADVFHLRAVLFSAMGAKDAARDELRKALYLDPRHYEALVQAALLADERGDRVEAGRLRERAAAAHETWTPRGSAKGSE